MCGASERRSKGKDAGSKGDGVVQWGKEREAQLGGRRPMEGGFMASLSPHGSFQCPRMGPLSLLTIPLPPCPVLQAFLSPLLFEDLVLLCGSPHLQLWSSGQRWCVRQEPNSTGLKPEFSSFRHTWIQVLYKGLGNSLSIFKF